MPEFFEVMDMEPKHIPLCRDCKGCSSCPYRAENFSPEEQRSVDYMEEHMHYDDEAKVIRVAYPLREAADQQPDNYKQVRKI